MPFCPEQGCGLVNAQIQELLEKLIEYRDPTSFESSAGREHLQEDIRPIIGTIDRLFEALRFAEGVPQGPHEGNVRQYLKNVLDIVENLASQSSDQQFYGEWNQAQNNLQSHYTKLLGELQDGLSIAVALGSPLGVEDVQDQVTKLEDELAEKDEALEQKTNEILENVNQEAEDILNQAREVAGRVALGEAQQEFSTLQKGYKMKAVAWGVVSMIGLGLYAWLIYFFMGQDPGVTGSLSQSIYPTTIRIFALGAGAAILAVLVRLFRSNLFLYEHSNHRISLTNSLPVFYESVSAEDRGRILGLLIGHIAEFGEPGLAGKRGDQSVPDQRGPVDRLIQLNE